MTSHPGRKRGKKASKGIGSFLENGGMWSILKLGTEQIQLMNTLDFVARVCARDCLVNADSVAFMVPEQQMSQAIGKNGSNVKAMTTKIRKRIELFEYTEKPEKFIEKAFHNAKLEGIEVKQVGESRIAFVKADAVNKKIMLGNMGRLRKIKELAKRNYSVDEIRIR